MIQITAEFPRRGSRTWKCLHWNYLCDGHVLCLTLADGTEIIIPLNSVAYITKIDKEITDDN